MSLSCSFFSRPIPPTAKHPRGNMVGQLIGRCDGGNYGKTDTGRVPQEQAGERSIADWAAGFRSTGDKQGY